MHPAEIRRAELQREQRYRDEFAGYRQSDLAPVIAAWKKRPKEELWEPEPEQKWGPMLMTLAGAGAGAYLGKSPQAASLGAQLGGMVGQKVF